MWKDPISGEVRGGVAKTSYSHEAMADLILANPAISQGEIARAFGYTEGWVSQVIGSDSFQAYLSTRKEQVLDPVLRGAVEESFKGLVLQSIARLREKLAANPSDELALEVFKNSSRALGYGARPNHTNIQINQTNNSLVGVLSSLPPAARVVDPA